MKLRELFENVQTISSHELLEMSKLTQGSVRLNNDGKLICASNFNMNTSRATDLFLEVSHGVTKLKYKFETVIGEFNVGSHELTTFENFPTIVKHNIDAWGNQFKNFDGLDISIDGLFDLQQNDKLTSFKGIDKHIRKCKQIIVPGGLKSHLIGVLKIEGLKKIATSYDEVSPKQIPELTLAIEIVNKYLESGRNINKCMSELEDSGLDDYAQL